MSTQLSAHMGGQYANKPSNLPFGRFPRAPAADRFAALLENARKNLDVMPRARTTFAEARSTSDAHIGSAASASAARTTIFALLISLFLSPIPHACFDISRQSHKVVLLYHKPDVPRGTIAPVRLLMGGAPFFCWTRCLSFASMNASV